MTLGIKHKAPILLSVSIRSDHVPAHSYKIQYILVYVLCYCINIFPMNVSLHCPELY